MSYHILRRQEERERSGRATQVSLSPGPEPVTFTSIAPRGSIEMPGGGSASIDDLFDRIQRGLERSLEKGQRPLPLHERNRFSSQFGCLRSDARRSVGKSSSSKPASSSAASTAAYRNILFGSQIRDSMLDTSYVPMPPKAKPEPPRPMRFQEPPFKFGAPSPWNALDLTSAFVSDGCSTGTSSSKSNGTGNFGGSRRISLPENEGPEPEPTFFFGLASSRQVRPEPVGSSGCAQQVKGLQGSIYTSQQVGDMIRDIGQAASPQVEEDSRYRTQGDVLRSMLGESGRDRRQYSRGRRITGESAAPAPAPARECQPTSANLPRTDSSSSLKSSGSTRRRTFSQRGSYCPSAHDSDIIPSRPAPFVDTTVLLLDANGDGDRRGPPRQVSTRSNRSSGRSASSSIKSSLKSVTSSMNSQVSWLSSSFLLSGSFVGNAGIGIGCEGQLESDNDTMMSAVLEDGFVDNGKESADVPSYPAHQAEQSPREGRADDHKRPRPRGDGAGRLGKRRPSEVSILSKAPRTDRSTSPGFRDPWATVGWGWDDDEVEGLAAFARSIVPNLKRRRMEE